MMPVWVNQGWECRAVQLAFTRESVLSTVLMMGGGDASAVPGGSVQGTGRDREITEAIIEGGSNEYHR